MARKRNDLNALRQMIGEAHDILRTITLPEQRSQRAYDLLTAAVHLADNLLEESPAATFSEPRAARPTAKRGPEYFRQDRLDAEGKEGRQAQEIPSEALSTETT